MIRPFPAIVVLAFSSASRSFQPPACYHRSQPRNAQGKFVTHQMRERNDLPKVKLKYFHKFPNVGDKFSALLAHSRFSNRILPEGNRVVGSPNLVLLGSILEWADENSYVCGAGFLSSNGTLLHRPASVQCVRGPLTAQLLESQGIDAPERYGDPGVLAPRLFPATGNAETEIGIVPHYVDSDVAWLDKCREEGIRVLDPLSPPHRFFRDLQGCEVILSSSLHGIIFAHAYGKPALWIELSDRVLGNGFKFFDYYSSVGFLPDQISRIRVELHTNPLDMALLASEADHSHLVSSVESAIQETKRLMIEATHENFSP